MDPDNTRHRVFYKILEKSKMARIRVHDMRHTYASLLLANGESLAYIKEQLGHSSIKVTCDLYGHLVPGGNRQAVDKLDTDVTLSPPFAKAKPKKSATPAQPIVGTGTI